LLEGSTSQGWGIVGTGRLQFTCLGHCWQEDFTGAGTVSTGRWVFTQAWDIVGR
jgi:hypothetical protein